MFEYGSAIDEFDSSLVTPLMKRMTLGPVTLHISGDQKNKNTIIIIPGGNGKFYTLNDGVMEGLVFPGNLVDHLYQDVNLVLASVPHGLPWVWTHVKLKNYPRTISEFAAISKNSPKQETIYQLLNSFVLLNGIIGVAGTEFPESKIWLAGHCTSCNLIAKFSDSVSDPNHYHGAIFMNPRRSHGDYFLRGFEKPLLVIQHMEDLSPGSSRDQPIPTATAVKEITGGTDFGYHSFSLGFHGFRDREDLVCQEIKTFVASYT